MSNNEKEKRQAAINFKHEIKNQLTNITLSLEQLRHAVPQNDADNDYYFETIFTSCKSINDLVNGL